MDKTRIIPDIPNDPYGEDLFGLKGIREKLARAERQNALEESWAVSSGLKSSGISSGIGITTARQYLKKVNTTYDRLMNVLFNKTEEFIEEMGRYWAAPVARDFFTKIFVPQINALLSYSHQLMNSVNSTVNNASERWARHNKAIWTIVPFTGVTKRVIDETASAIKEQINGVQGIDKINAIEAMKKFANYKKDIEEILAEAIRAANGAGFLGGTQESSLINAITKLKNKMTSSIDTITRDMNTAITKTVELYEDQEGRVSKVFEELGTGVGELVSGAVAAVADWFDFE